MPPCDYKACSAYNAHSTHAAAQVGGKPLARKICPPIAQAVLILETPLAGRGGFFPGQFVCTFLPGHRSKNNRTKNQGNRENLTNSKIPGSTSTPGSAEKDLQLKRAIWNWIWGS